MVLSFSWPGEKILGLKRISKMMSLTDPTSLQASLQHLPEQGQISCLWVFIFENVMCSERVCVATVRWRPSSNQMQLWVPEEHYPAGCACRAVDSSGRCGAFWNTAWGKFSLKPLSNRADMWRLAFVFVKHELCFFSAGFGSLSGHNTGAARSGQWHTEDFIQVKRLWNSQKHDILVVFVVRSLIDAF